MFDLVDVQCAECGELDQVYWGEFGSKNSCPVCNASPADLFLVN